MQNAKSLILGIVALATIGAWADSMTVSRRCGRDWRDGTFLGDGQTGVIAYAPMHFEWLINRNDVIDGRIRLDHRITHAEVMKHIEAAAPKDRNSRFLEEADGCYSRYEHRDTVSAAILRLSLWGGIGWAAPAAPEMTERMSLRDGELVQRAVSGSINATVSTCVLREEDVVAISIVRTAGSEFLELARPEDPRLEPMKWISRSGKLKLFSQKLPDGNSYAVALAGEKGNYVLAVRTTRDCADPVAAARTAAEKAAARGFAAIRGANAKWWNDFWNRGGNVCFASEPEVDLAWHQCLFAMAASYGKPPMPGLNGLVYGPTSPSVPGVTFSDYTHDQNVQIPMFAFNPVNHCEFVRSFSGTYERVRKVLEENTRALYGTPGIGIPLAINQDGYENPTGSYRYSLCGAAYSALVLAQAWRYSRDVGILKDIYPLLKDFVEFNLGLMKKDETGRYRQDWMVPPEIFTMTRNELCSIACLKTSLATLVEASEVLGRDAERRAHWKDVLAHYPQFVRQSGGGWWCGPDIPDDHGMYGGHLFYPFYPAECAIGPDDRQTTLKTIDYLCRRGYDYSNALSVPHPAHDWTAYYLAVARLRLCPREVGWREVTEYLRLFRKPNGFYSHNAIVVDPDFADARAGRSTVFVTPNSDAKRLAAPVIEGFGAFLFISTESLLQSWDGKIRLFPGVPKNFTGSFTNLLAQGGVRVSAEMRDGKLVSKTVVPAERTVDCVCDAEEWQPRREALVFVGAHPDDSEGFAATAFLLRDKYDIHVVDLTRGELGLGMPGLKDGSTGRRRTEEEKAACAYLGATPHFLHEVDGFACAGEKSVDALTKLIDELKPRAVFTHWPVDNHADHVQTAAVVANALRRVKIRPERYFFEVQFVQTSNYRPLYRVDVSSVMPQKLKMLACYDCQNANNGLVEDNRQRALVRGRECGVPFAETFTTWDGMRIPGGVLESIALPFNR